MPGIFFDNNTLTVNALGPGTLYLLSFHSNPTNNPPFVVGHLESTATDNSVRYLISFSHNYNQFAFYWSGAGPANYTVSKTLVSGPVGKNWSQASSVGWGDPNVGTRDVTSFVPTAIDRGNVTTLYII